MNTQKDSVQLSGYLITALASDTIAGKIHNFQARHAFDCLENGQYTLTTQSQE